MNRWNAWRSVLGLASLSLAIVGCGGSDIPDPDADSNAAAEPASSAPAPAPAAPAPAAPTPAVAATEAPAEAAPVEAPAPAATQAPEPVAAATATEEIAAAAAPATAEAETPSATADPSRAKNAAATAELLALGNKPLPTEEPAAATAATATNGSAAPGDPGDMANRSSMMPGPIPSSGPPGAASGVMPPGMAGDPAANVGAPGSEIPGYPGGADGADSGGSTDRANFRSPTSAVDAFLKALKAKNAERLAEATARRAPTEASGPKNQKLFASILEQSLTEDDLNDLANKLEGYQVVGNNTPKSTGKYALILGKPGKNGEYYRRTITARHEKDGWKVVDIGGVGKVEKPIIGGRMRGRR